MGVSAAVKDKKGCGTKIGVHIVKGRRRGKSLRAKIVAWSFIPTGIILCLVALVIFFALAETTKTAAIDQSMTFTYLTANDVARIIDNFIEPINLLAHEPQLFSGGTAQQRNALIAVANGAMVSEKIGLPGVVKLDSMGRVIAAYPAELATIGDSWADYPYYRAVLRSLLAESVQPVLSDVVTYGPDEIQLIVLSIPVFSSTSMRYGMVAVLLPLKMINALNPFGENDSALRGIIVDSTGRVIYHQEAQYVGADFSAWVPVQQVLSGTTGVLQTRNIEGEQVVIGFTPIPDTSWYLITETDWISMLDYSRGYLGALALLLALGVLVPTVVIAIGARKITRPITDLMTAVDGVASGNFDQLTVARTGDEIEALARQFNAMAAKLHASYGALERDVANRTHELATLNAIAGVVNRSLDLDVTLRDVLEEILIRMGAEVGAIFFLNPVDHSMTLRVQQGMGEAWAAAARQLQSGEGIIGQAVAERQTVAMRMTEYDTARLAPFMTERQIQTLAATPIISKEQVLGALFLGMLQEHPFPPEEQALLFAIGQQIGVGVENAQLYTQVQQELAERKRAQERLRWVGEERARRNRELALLNRVIAATTSQLAPQAILEAVCRELALAFDIPQAAAAMLAADRQSLTVVAEYQLDPDGPKAINAVIPIVGNASTQYVLERKVPLAITDAQHDPRLASAHTLMRERGVYSILLLPLIVRGEVMGTIGLDSLKPRDFTQEEVNLALSAASAAAQALEKARAEAELRESEVRYRELFNRSPIGIFRATPGGLIVDANPTLRDLLELDSLAPDEASLASLYLDPTGHDRLLQHIHAGPVSDFETRFKRGDGSVIYVSIRATLTYNEEGVPEFLQGTLVDITERRKAERELRESRERLQLAIEGAGLGMWDLNLLTDEQIMNYDWWEHLGYSHEEGATCFEDIANLVHPDDRGKMADAFNDHLSGKTPLYEVELRIQAKTAEWVWVLFRGKIVAYDETGKPLRMAGISQDITARKVAEQALRESEDRLKVAMEAAGLGLWDQNLRTDELMVSSYQEAEDEECCWEAGPTQLEKLRQKIHPDDREKFDQALTAHLSGAASLYEVEFRVPDTAGGWRWQLQRGRVVAWDDAGQPLRMTGIYEDVTPRKQAEEELRQAKDAAEAANRAKSIFLANMSHELRTPLNAILGFAQLLVRDPHITTTQRENLETISRSGQHLLTLINDVLEMSKIEAGRTTLYEDHFDLYRMLDALEDMFELRATQKGLQLTFEREPGVPQYIYTDESKLRQVLINLLGNAIKFTEEGGVILRVRGEEIGNRGEGIGKDAAATDKSSLSPFSYLLTPNSYLLHFEVQDTGVGIAPEELGRLFTAFVQTSSGQKSQEGTGLGLPISQQYVHLLGGEITAKSVVGQGSVFSFDVQVALSDAAQVHVEVERRRVVGIEPGQRAADGGPYRLLIAEDKWTNRQLLIQLLAPLGFELREANNGAEAIEYWEAWEPHLIWMDMRMPVMDGHEATRHIKATTKGQATVIIALTASAFEEDRRVILSEGCDDFVRKPFREDDIFGMLEKHLGIRFIYEEIAHPSTVPAEAEPSDLLAPDALHHLPPTWRADLHQAAVETDATRILGLVAEIRPQEPTLADALTHMVNNFRFDIIMSLTQS